MTMYVSRVSQLLRQNSDSCGFGVQLHAISGRKINDIISCVDTN